MDEEIKKILEDHEKRIKSIERFLTRTEEVKPKKELSLKEFILQKKPHDDVQKTLVIGYYLENNKNFNSFNTKDLENGFRVAKEKLPKNINDKVNHNIINAHMTDAEKKKENRKAWVLTSSGVRFVSNDFKKVK